MVEHKGRRLLIAVVGGKAASSGWAALLALDGIPFQACASVDELDREPDFSIFLSDSGVSPQDRPRSPALFDRCCPPGGEVEGAIWAEGIEEGEGGGFRAPFRGWAVRWGGASLGTVRFAPGDESPAYPVACFADQHGFLVGDVADSLVSHGFCFHPACTGQRGEVHVIHPPAARSRLCRFLRQVLGTTLGRAGLPSFRLCPYPPGFGRPFLFRVDVDYLVDPRMRPLRRQAACQGWQLTAFVNISGEEKWEDGGPVPPGGCQPLRNLQWLAELGAEGHEVACHGFRHRLWPDYPSVLNDLSHAKAILEKLVAQPVRGVAFAGGLWHPVAARAARAAGFDYSSEASLAWDGDPFHPMSATGEEHPLQVPCSPLFPAYYELAGGDAALFGARFSRLENSRRDEALSLMGHPADLEGAPQRFWDELGAIVVAAGCRPVTMSALARAHLQRQHVGLEVFAKAGGWHATVERAWELFVGEEKVLLEPGRLLPLPMRAQADEAYE